MSAPALIAVVTTVASAAEAEAIATALVESRLAACVQVEAIDSVYRWQGRVERAAEHRVVAKALRERYEAIAAAIRARHSHELPAIWSVAVDRADPAYARWVAVESAAAGVADVSGS